jgi:hypothetical protein
LEGSILGRRLDLTGAVDGANISYTLAIWRTNMNGGNFKSPGGSTYLQGNSTTSDQRLPAQLEHYELLESHLQIALGVKPMVFHEIISDVVTIDVLIFPPSGDRVEWILVTAGMSALPMTLPEGVSSENFARAELVISLPPAWGADLNTSLSNNETVTAEVLYWPLRELKALARYPHVSGTYFASGHTVPSLNESPYHESTGFDGCLLSHSLHLPEETVVLDLPSGERLSLLGVMFLYPEEVECKLQNGLTQLLRLLDKVGVSEYVDATRKSAVRKKRFFGLL